MEMFLSQMVIQPVMFAQNVFILSLNICWAYGMLWTFSTGANVFRKKLSATQLQEYTQDQASDPGHNEIVM